MKDKLGLKVGNNAANQMFWNLDLSFTNRIRLCILFCNLISLSTATILQEKYVIIFYSHKKQVFDNNYDHYDKGFGEF